MDLFKPLETIKQQHKIHSGAEGVILHWRRVGNVLKGYIDFWNPMFDLRIFDSTPLNNIKFFLPDNLTPVDIDHWHMVPGGQCMRMEIAVVIEEWTPFIPIVRDGENSD